MSGVVFCPPSHTDQSDAAIKKQVSSVRQRTDTTEQQSEDDCLDPSTSPCEEQPSLSLLPPKGSGLGRGPEQTRSYAHACGRVFLFHLFEGLLTADARVSLWQPPCSSQQQTRDQTCGRQQTRNDSPATLHVTSFHPDSCQPGLGRVALTGRLPALRNIHVNRLAPNTGVHQWVQNSSSHSGMR